MKILGTALCLSSALLVSTAVQASWERNWLLGVSGGLAEQENHFYLTMVHTAPLGLQTNYTRELNKTNSSWGLFGGYQVMSCDGWLMGAELNVDWQSKKTSSFAFTDATNIGWNADMQYKREYGVGLSARLGHDFSAIILPYVRVGGEFSIDEMHFEATNTADVRVADASRNHTVYRWLLGAGVELPFPWCQAFSVRAEYLYHSKGRGIDADAITSDNATFVQVADTQRINEGKLALVWNF